VWRTPALKTHYDCKRLCDWPSRRICGALKQCHVRFYWLSFVRSTAGHGLCMWEKLRERAKNAVFGHPCTDPPTLPCLGCGGTRCLGCRAGHPPSSWCGVPSNARTRACTRANPAKQRPKQLSEHGASNRSTAATVDPSSSTQRHVPTGLQCG